MKDSRIHKPNGIGGSYPRWDYSVHAGCKFDADQCLQGKRELIKLKGLRPVINRNLIRRGGHRGNKKIAISGIDGYVQSLRRQPTTGDLNNRSKLGTKGASGGRNTPIGLIRCVVAALCS